MNNFERHIDPKEAMDIGRKPMSKELFEWFKYELKNVFPDLYFPGIKLHLASLPEGEYISIDLDPYSNQGMDYLQNVIENLMKTPFHNRLVFVVDEYLEKLYGKEWPEESPFYDEERIYIKIL